MKRRNHGGVQGAGGATGRAHGNGTGRRTSGASLTLPPTFIQRERDCGFEFCPFGRVGQRGLARSFADCAALGPVAGRRFGRTRRAFASRGESVVVQYYSPCARQRAWHVHDAGTGTASRSRSRPLPGRRCLHRREGRRRSLKLLIKALLVGFKGAMYCQSKFT